MNEDDDKSENEIEKKKHNNQTKKYNMEYLLSNALSSKLNYFNSYFVRYILYIIREKEREDKDYYKKEAAEILMKLQREAIENHIAILNLLKKFFHYIKSRNKGDHEKFFNMNRFLELFFDLKKETLKLYNEIFEKYPDEKSTYQVYSLFMKDVFNTTNDKYILNEGDSFMALNDPNKDEEHVPASSFGESAINSTEVKQKRLKDKMINNFNVKHKKISRIIFIMFFITGIFYVICVFYGYKHTNNYLSLIRYIEDLDNMDYRIKDVILNIRFYGFAIMSKDLEFIETQRTKIKNGINYMEEVYLPLLQPHSNEPASETRVIVFGEQTITNETETRIEYFNSFELTEKVIMWVHTIIEPTPEEWVERVNNGENVLKSFIFKMFAINSEGRFDDVICESVDIFYENEIGSSDKEMKILYILSGSMILISLLINIMGIIPLYRYSKNLENNILRLFKYLLNSSLSDLISRFEDGIDSITEIYDIILEEKRDYLNKLSNENGIIKIFYKIRGYIVNILLITMIITLVYPIITTDSEILTNLEYNKEVGERKDKILDMNTFSLETLLQDPGNGVPGTWETLLFKKVKDLENLQVKLYQGKLGLASETKMRYLDDYLIKFGCKLNETACDNIEEDYNIGYTKSLLILGINEIVDELVTSGTSIVNMAKIRNYKKDYDNVNNEITAEKFMNNCLGNPYYLFQFKMLDYILPTVLKLEGILYDKNVDTVKSTLFNMIYIIALGIILYIISSILTYKIVQSTNKTTNELVNIVFLIPQTTINMIPQFKKFIESGSFEE
ncbi:hypothetical protein BCR32DRAFT_270507 [Anaeromyces robustus]|uniref:Uncharacterized protein n=1 Tax=Anaeromyces robustus TaxID=1754192 RepID=A0A1Y1WVV9_9FUNG|nr:hypothetical protein BCR32DRAFT_270507 [Anaeromyces robustus]|eukprot:ORX77653.1 hypothetical protein BCR32DRAFT_270507 [Anaeromyces robustus]